MTCQEIEKAINKNGLRHDYLANILKISNGYFTMILKGSRTLKNEHMDILNMVLLQYDKARKKIRYGE